MDPVHGWAVATALLAIAEVVLGTLVLVPLAAGTAVAAVAAWLGLGPVVQWLSVSAGMAATTVLLLRHAPSDAAAVAPHRLVGTVGRVTRPVDTLTPGTVALHGETWLAVPDGDLVFDVDDRVVVVRVEGTRAVVSLPSG